MRSPFGNISGFGNPFTGLTGKGFGFSPDAIFDNGENGSLLEAPTLDTLYTDDAGTTQATVGDPMGLWLDKSQGLVLGPELVTNGTFDTDTDWTLASGATISGGALSASGVAANTTFAKQSESPALTAGAFYEVRFTVSNYSSGDLSVFFFGGGNVSSSFVSGNGEYTGVIQATAAHTTISLRTGGGGLTADIDNFSVRELPGNHATQTTAANRMVVSGTGPYYLNPDAVNDNFEIPLGAGFTGDFCLILDTGPIFGSIDTGTDTTWNYTVNPAYIPDGNVHALIVVDRAFTLAEKQRLVDHYADAVTSVPSTANGAFRERTDLTALDASYGDWTQVTNAFRAFLNCTGLTTPPDVSGWTGVTNAFRAFSGCSGLTSPPDVSGWTQVTSAVAAFFGCTGLTTPPDVSGWTQVTSADSTFLSCSSLTTPPDVSGWTGVTNARAAFQNCSGLTTPPDVSGWTGVTNAFATFYNCSGLTSPPDVSGWTQVTNARAAFQFCSGLTTPPDVSGWTQVTSARDAFYQCSGLTTPPDVSGWTQVTSARAAFANCPGLTSPPDVTGWTQVTDAFYAFRNCSGLTTPPDVSGWTGVTDATRAFDGCSGFTTPPNVSDWTQVTNASFAFQNCFSLGSAINLDNWNPTILTDGTDMMSGISAAGFDQTAYDSALTAWDIAYDLTTVNTIDIHFGSAQYGSGAPATARGILDTNGWTITDGGFTLAVSGFAPDLVADFTNEYYEAAS